MAFTAFAVTAPGLESLAASELRELGLTRVVAEPGGVRFGATDALLAASLLHLRTATRVLVRVAEFRVTSFSQLERRANAVAWNAWVHEGGRVRFRVTCRKSRLYHSDAVAERLVAAVAGSVSGAHPAGGAGEEDGASDGDGASEVDRAGDADAADKDDGADNVQLFVVRLAHDVCTISVDAAGAALHRRGYRQALAKAPLRETLAAGMLLGAKWDGSTALCDPFCGSGTIAIEAALLARGVPPGVRRSFAAERWPSADASLWREVRGRAASVAHDALLPPIVGSDRDAGAVEAARANAERAGVGGDIEFTIGPVSAVHAPAAAGLLVTNPPYGIRTGDTATLRNLYSRFGAVARREFAGWRAAVLSADRTRGHVLERQLGLRLAPAWRSVNGGIPVRLLVGEIQS